MVANGIISFRIKDMIYCKTETTNHEFEIWKDILNKFIKITMHNSYTDF